MKKSNKKISQATKTTLELELEVKMQEWVMWIKTGNNVDIGYPRCSTMILIMQGHNLVREKNKTLSSPGNADAELIERLITEMANYKPLMAESIRSYYLQQYSLRKNAARLGISHMRYKIYVMMAKEWLVGRLY